MHIRFLLGPAGSGKTFLCLKEIRDALRDPDGPALLLLAPKQATFQLERQLLSPAASELAGYTRLRIVSFDRLALSILEEFSDAAPDLLQEEGRLMVLRALLGRHQSQLKIFHATARLPGFAQQLSRLLGELQQQKISPARLTALAGQFSTQPTLAGKLHDAALLLDAYLGWLRAHQLQDVNCLLDLAAAELRRAVASGKIPLRTAGLWLDGFAQMTPQEIDLLAAFLPVCDRATLAFCLDAECDDRSWLSGWSVIHQTFHQCLDRAKALPDAEVVVETLPREPGKNRFDGSPILGELEKTWAAGSTAAPQRETRNPESALRLALCATPEAEAVLAAREIRQFVRSGGRFRDAAVLVRQLAGYDDALRRVFLRYDIPFFLDRREPVAHHPLAELTRYALRLAAYGWQHDDWFGALKTGLASVDDAVIDRLENEALARGWQGNVWLQPLKISDDARLEESLNRPLKQTLPPFVRWHETLAAVQRRPSARQLAAALRELWNDLDVEKILEQWSTASPGPSAIHLTVFDQLSAWLENFERAFADEALPLPEWLPILEAGLAQLTVGVIPPSLDQVLIGAIDRSRNPEIKLAVLPGWNESVFPAPPSPGPLLTETERDALVGRDVPLAPGQRQQIGHERYYAYIACTRARERVVITCAAQNAGGEPLNPSPFFDEVKQITSVAPELFTGVADWRNAGHACELAAPVLRNQSASEPTSVRLETAAISSLSSSKGGEGRGEDASEEHPTSNIQHPTSKASDCGIPSNGCSTFPLAPLAELAALPALAPLVHKWHQLAAAAQATRLSIAGAEKIYGRELRTSVSGLEDFAACPFKFFAARGLRLEERKEFEFDDRDKGSFQHEVLCEFHRHLHAAGRRWRDLSVADARALVTQIGRAWLPAFGGGRFLARGAARFTGELLIERLGRLVAALVEWLPQYGFNPEVVEISFGLDDQALPAWRIELPGGRALLLRGRIDRIDLCRDGDDTFAVVMDYKSSVRALSPAKLHHGLELQLLSYLGVLRHLRDPEKFFGAKRLVPAGVFYVPLNGGAGAPGKTRAEILAAGDAARRATYQHSGRFLADALPHFDNRGGAKGDQFKFAKNKDGSFRASGNEALPAAEFAALREKVEHHLRDYGRRIFEGEAAIAPFRIGRQTACDRCDFRAGCRFDPWTQPYRDLRPPVKGRA